MKPVFERIAVVGLGLLGGSLALAARERGVAGVSVGATRSPEACRLALESGAVSEVLDLEHVATHADLVVLATPVHAMPEMLRRLAPQLAEGAVVTDVGSVKAPLAETLPGLLPPGRTYIGSHPMAGSHERGMHHADPALFEGACCIVTEHQAEPAEARVCAFWEGLGMRVVRRSPARHDEEVGWVSHLPHLLAYAFAEGFAAAPPGAAELVGPGFRDFTRIARSDAELWGDILGANAKALEGPLELVSGTLSELSRLLQAGDSAALEQRLQRARGALASTAQNQSNVSRHGANADPDGNASGTKGDQYRTHE